MTNSNTRLKESCLLISSAWVFRFLAVSHHHHIYMYIPSRHWTPPFCGNTRPAYTSLCGRRRTQVYVLYVIVCAVCACVYLHILIWRCFCVGSLIRARIYTYIHIHVYTYIQHLRCGKRLHKKKIKKELRACFHLRCQAVKLQNLPFFCAFIFFVLFSKLSSRTEVLFIHAGWPTILRGSIFFFYTFFILFFSFFL